MAQKNTTVTATEGEVGGDVPSEEKAEAKATEATEPAVVYVGQAPVRTVSREEFEQAGVTDQDTATWSKPNKYSVKKSAFSEAAIGVLLQDGSFRVVGE